MKTTYKHLLDAAFYLVLFLLLQLVIFVPVSLVCRFKLDPANFQTQSTLIASSLSSVVAIALFAWRRWSQSSRDYTKHLLRPTLPWVVALGVGCLVPLMLVQDLLQLKMPDEEILTFKNLVASDFGYIALALLAPVAEEMVFRGAVLRKLLDCTGHRYRWVAIAGSALLFGLAHGNAAQMVNALIAGLLLGWMYCRTRSVIPGVVFHWVNNTAAFAMVRLIPQSADMTLLQLYGGDWTRVALATLFSLCIFAASLYQLKTRF